MTIAQSILSCERFPIRAIRAVRGSMISARLASGVVLVVPSWLPFFLVLRDAE